MKNNFIYFIYNTVITHINGWVKLFKSSEISVFSTNHKYINIMFLLFLFFLEMSLIYYHTIISINYNYYLIIIILILIIIIYWVFYIWCKISRSFWSFIRFFINAFLFIIMLSVIFKIIKGLDKPIYIYELPVSTGIRYGIFIIFFILGALLLFVNKNFNSLNINKFYLKSTFPYLMEESKTILSVWENCFFGPLFEKLMYQLAFNKIKCFFILSLHFILYYFIPLTQSLFLFNFAFFNGDFRYNLYLMPLSILSWFFKHFWYYFITFFNENVVGIRRELHVFYNDEILSEQEFIFVDCAKIECSLKNPTTDYFYNQELVLQLKQYLILVANVEVKLHFYKNVTKYFTHVILSIRFLSWCIICFKILNQSEVFLNTLPSLISAICFTKMLSRTYVTESFFVKQASQKALEKLTKGAYSKGHPVTTDVNKPDSNGDIPFYHQPTHGAGPASNPSKPLSSTVDVEGNAGIQNAVYPTNKTYMPASWLENKIPNSTNFYNLAEVKANDDKNDKHFSSSEKD